MGGDGGSSRWWLFLALVWLWMGFSMAEVLNVSVAWRWDLRDAKLFWALLFGLGFWDIWCAMEPTMEFPASWWSCVVVGVLWWFLDGFELCGVSFMCWSFQVQEMGFRLGDWWCWPVGRKIWVSFVAFWFRTGGLCECLEELWWRYGWRVRMVRTKSPSLSFCLVFAYIEVKERVKERKRECREHKIWKMVECRSF